MVEIGCGCGKKSGTSAMYNIEVRFKDGTVRVYKDRPSARMGMAALRMTGSMRQVLAKDNPVTG